VRRGGDDELVGLGAQDVLLGDRGNDVLIGEGPCPPPPEGDYCDAGMPGDDVTLVAQATTTQPATGATTS
jgi:Ca2+-binding RTX toxin-like protein